MKGKKEMFKVSFDGAVDYVTSYVKLTRSIKDIKPGQEMKITRA